MITLRPSNFTPSRALLLAEIGSQTEVKFHGLRGSVIIRSHSSWNEERRRGGRSCHETDTSYRNLRARLGAFRLRRDPSPTTFPGNGSDAAWVARPGPAGLRLPHGVRSPAGWSCGAAADR